MKNKITTGVAIFLSLLVMGLVHCGWLYYEENGNNASRRIEIKVHPGTTLKEVQALLVERGLLEHPDVFRWAAFLTGKERKIQTGRYLFRRGESVSRILNKLARGEVDYSRVVIPEGFILKEIAGLLQQETELDSAEFVSVATDTAFIRELGIDAPSLEGYLFPDTYLFNWPLTAHEAVNRMIHRFNEVFDDSLRAFADSLKLSLREVVTLASIIQAEAIFDYEMERISAVYHNRLARGWRLEADPTVAYALGGVRRKLWYKDLRVDSPYNTYRVRGLPPGPICSPGRQALEAAVRPLEGCGDLYFIANGISGRHIFSRTLKDHIRAKNRVKYGGIPLVEEFKEEKLEGAVKEVISE